MKYDFTTIWDRAGKDAMAVDAIEKFPIFQPDGGFDSIPMWVADMNFATAPSIVEAMQKRLEHPLFGYFITSDEYFDAIINWQKNRNGVQGLEKEHIGYENGVLGGVMSALGAVCCQGDAVLVHSPTYIGFSGSIKNAGYKLVTSPLKPDRLGIPRMDFYDRKPTSKETRPPYNNLVNTSLPKLSVPSQCSGDIGRNLCKGSTALGSYGDRGAHITHKVINIKIAPLMIIALRELEIFFIIYLPSSL